MKERALVIWGNSVLGAGTSQGRAPRQGCIWNGREEASGLVEGGGGRAVEDGVGGGKLHVFSSKSHRIC